MPGIDHLPEQLPACIGRLSPNEFEALSLSHTQAAVVSVRLNPHKPSDSFEATSPVPWCAQGRYLDTRPVFTADPLFHAGCYYVQEASSMLLDFALHELLNPDDTLIALDLCAAPGGKSTLLSSFLNDTSLLLSNEVISSRISMLTENMCKWGRMNNWVTHNDPKHFSSLKGQFDLVLVDAPCSGTGLFRKMPAYANDWNEDMVQLCAQRQQRILHDIDGILSEQGILVYMTCSFCEAENEEIVDYILQHFEVESCRLPVPPEWGIEETLSTLKQGAGYRCYPHKVKGEGFFLACFRHRGKEAKGFYAGISRKQRVSADREVLLPFMDMAGKSMIVQNDLTFVVNEEHEYLLQQFSKTLKIVRKGVLAGKIIRGELVPEHELSMSVDIRHHIPFVELTYEEAIAFLQKEAIQVACPAKGWLVARYKGHNLGWIKNLGNRINNYYPSSYRILNKQIGLEE